MLRHNPYVKPEVPIMMVMDCNNPLPQLPTVGGPDSNINNRSKRTRSDHYNPYATWDNNRPIIYRN